MIGARFEVYLVRLDPTEKLIPQVLKEWDQVGGETVIHFSSSRG